MHIKKQEFQDEMRLDGKKVLYYSLPKLCRRFAKVRSWPFSMRILLESLARNLNGVEVKEGDIGHLLEWNADSVPEYDIPFIVSRVLMQDLTGVPAVVDIAAMREYVRRKGFDAGLVTPQMPIDLIIDHSVQVDEYACTGALKANQRKEILRNGERYRLLKWAGTTFSNFSVVPPSGGICHQVNLEHIATCVSTKTVDGSVLAFPDTLVGTDSHTTMINGLGVVGYGVGGIEAEAALLGQPVALGIPKVVGVRLDGRLGEGVTATDLALTLTRTLREVGVVGAFVEFFGEGVSGLSLPDRATVSNMCPEYGATISIFPVDRETINYMRSTGRSAKHLRLVERYYKTQEMFGMDYSKVRFSRTLHIDLNDIEPCVSGPSQPKQEMPLAGIKHSVAALSNSRDANRRDEGRWAWENAGISGYDEHGGENKQHGGGLRRGDVVISAITSCTNTSNPFVMIGAGLLAKKAVGMGLKVPEHVKTSFAPGSRVVVDYLKQAGLMKYLERLGYGLVGYGCTTCIGNSGTLPRWVSEEIHSKGIEVASVLSGNRNYEARIHNDVAANYLMSPMLVIAFGIAGTVTRDLTKEPLGTGKNGKAVYLKNIWPTNKEIRDTIGRAVKSEMFAAEYKRIFGVNTYWNALKAPKASSYAWEEKSTYIRLPPFFDGFDQGIAGDICSIENARVLAVFGDSLSTDHISPAGSIPTGSPAARYLIEHDVDPGNFNTYGSRRGNHEVMMRGTFANVKIRNLMVERQGGYTLHMPDMREMSIYDAAMTYRKEKRPLVVFGGAEYGSGSSRDWAAKGPMLLGVRAVVAKGFERIHRSNLVGMGIIPLQFAPGEGFAELGIDPSKTVSIRIGNDTAPGGSVRMEYRRKGSSTAMYVMLISRLDTELEMDYIRSGGVLRHVLKGIIKRQHADKHLYE